MKSIYICILLTILTSCKNELAFDSEKWNEQTDVGIYPNRELMLRDIIENKKLIGFTYKAIFDSLGQPENYSNRRMNEIWYSVTVNYGIDIDPVYSKDLLLTFGKDSTVYKVEIREWRK